MTQNQHQDTNVLSAQPEVVGCAIANLNVKTAGVNCGKVVSETKKKIILVWQRRQRHQTTTTALSADTYVQLPAVQHYCKVNNTFIRYPVVSITNLNDSSSSYSRELISPEICSSLSTHTNSLTTVRMSYRCDYGM